jgi:cytochrome c oxidase subunit 1
MHLLGMAGHPRQYAQLTEVNYLQSLLPLQRFITWAALLTAAGQLVFLWNLFGTFFREKENVLNPWQSTTLEWVPLPAGAEIQRGAYEFVSGNGNDFHAQADPV